MTDEHFEGTVVLEQLAEAGLVDDFLEAVDADDVEHAVALMREAGVDRATIATVVEKIEEADGKH